MSSHPILPEARRAAIVAAFDEALAEVRAAADVALLQECRAIFRRRVPLSMRAYVAAALVLGRSGASKQSDRRGRNAVDAGRADDPSRTRGSDGGQREGKSRKNGAGAAQTAKHERPKQEIKQGDEAVQRDRRDIREHRYRGEGITLFVSAGRRQRFYARIAVKMLLDIPGVTEESVGDIRTMDNYCFIVVDPAIEDTVIAALNGYDFKGRILAANRARKRGEPPLREEQGEYATVSGDGSVADEFGDLPDEASGDIGDDPIDNA